MRDTRRPWPTAPEGKDRVRVIRNPSRRRVVRRARRDPRPKGPAMSSAYRSWLWTTCISCRSWFLPANAASGNPESKPHNHTRRTAPSNPVSQSPGQHPSNRPPERKPCLAWWPLSGCAHEEQASRAKCLHWLVGQAARLPLPLLHDHCMRGFNDLDRTPGGTSEGDEDTQQVLGGRHDTCRAAAPTSSARAVGGGLRD